MRGFSRTGEGKKKKTKTSKAPRLSPPISSTRQATPRRVHWLVTSTQTAASHTKHELPADCATFLQEPHTSGRQILSRKYNQVILLTVTTLTKKLAGITFSILVFTKGTRFDSLLQEKLNKNNLKRSMTAGRYIKLLTRLNSNDRKPSERIGNISKTFRRCELERTNFSVKPASCHSNSRTKLRNTSGSDQQKCIGSTKMTI